MPTHQETLPSPYNTQQLFELVADVERYPEFLPWCRAARVLERSENEMLAELVISFAHLTERYTSRILLTPPGKPGDEAAIDVTMVKGPFHHLINRWRFMPAPEGGSLIDFYLDFQFRSKLLETLIGGLFSKAVATMNGAFRTRADQLYGQSG